MGIGSGGWGRGTGPKLLAIFTREEISLYHTGMCSGSLTITRISISGNSYYYLVINQVILGKL